MTQSPRHPLAFGDHPAKTLATITDAQNEAARLLPGLISWELFDPNDFQFKSSRVDVNGLPLVAFSTPPTRIRFRAHPEPVLVFPWTGQAKFTAEKRAMAMQTNVSAIFVPTGHRSEVEGDSQSVAVASIDAKRLEVTLSTMLGRQWATASAASLGRPLEVSLAYGTVSFDAVFRALFAAIDAYAENRQMLAVAGIDDIFYRTLAMALCPAAFVTEVGTRLGSVDSRKLDRVCQHVQAQLGSPITLTALEQVGFMSRRTLHNAFMKTFGVSPMAWVREQRLIAVRIVLQKHAFGQTVSQALYSCGFKNPSLFASQYKRRFGELPSVTREHSQNKAP